MTLCTLAAVDWTQVTPFKVEIFPVLLERYEVSLPRMVTYDYAVIHDPFEGELVRRSINMHSGLKRQFLHIMFCFTCYCNVTGHVTYGQANLIVPVFTPFKPVRV